MPGTKRFETIRDHRQSSDRPGGLRGDKHGACIASKIGGPSFGVAKRISLMVMLRMPQVIRGSDVLDALLYIKQNVDPDMARGKAVVNLSGICKYISLSISELALTSTP